MIEELKKNVNIEQVNAWAKGEHDRIYITPAGYDSSFAGCRSTKIYWDNKARRMVGSLGKGRAPDAYWDAVSALESEYKFQVA